MPTPLETIRKGEEEFEDKTTTTEQAGGWLIPYEGCLEYKILEWHKQTLKATLQALWDEAEGRKKEETHMCVSNTNHSLCWNVEHNQAIQTYQDSLLELIKAI